MRLLNKTINNNSELTPWFCAILILFESLPKWMWGMYQLLPDLIPVLFLIIAYKDIIKHKANQWAIIALLLQLIVIFVFYAERMKGIVGFGINMACWMGFISIFLCSSVFIKECVNCFVKILAVLLLLSLVEHFLLFFSGLSFSSPVYMECPYNPDREYVTYLFNVYINDLSFFSFLPRFYAFYDEPGALGNIMMVLLYCGRFDLRKWYNIVFMISGFLSFSFAFFCAVIIWYLIFGNFKTKLLFAIAILIFVFLFYKSEYLYDMIFSRFEFTDEGLSGYNRERYDFKSWYDKLTIDQYLFWGVKTSGAIPYAASWKWAFAIYGIIPSLLYCFALLMSRINKFFKRKDILMGLCIILIIFIQRPFFYRWFYAFMMVMPLIYYQANTSKIVCSHNDRNNDREITNRNNLI